MCYNLYKLEKELNFLNNSIPKKHVLAYGITSSIAADILIELFQKHKLNKIINPKNFIESINVYSRESINIHGSRNIYDIITEVYLEKFDIKKINF